VESSRSIDEATNSLTAEARLRRSLGTLRHEVTSLVAVTGRTGAKDSFEDTLQSAMDRIKKLLGFSYRQERG
jgi:hypothetical protein